MVSTSVGLTRRLVGLRWAVGVLAWGVKGGGEVPCGSSGDEVETGGETGVSIMRGCCVGSGISSIGKESGDKMADSDLSEAYVLSDGSALKLIVENLDLGR